MEINYVDDAKDLMEHGHKVKFGIFLDGKKANAIIFPHSTLHIVAVKKEMKSHTDWRFIGAGALGKYADPMWGSESCEAELGYDRPEDGGELLLRELGDKISNS
jgi:hypothetical protein